MGFIKFIKNLFSFSRSQRFVLLTIFLFFIITISISHEGSVTQPTFIKKVYAQPSGDQKTAVALMKYNNSPSTTVTKNTVNNQVFYDPAKLSAPSVNNYYVENSFGKTFFTGTTSDWLNINKSSPYTTSYCDDNLIIGDTILTANPFFNFFQNGITRLIIVTPPRQGCPQRTSTSGEIPIQDPSGNTVNMSVTVVDTDAIEQGNGIPEISKGIGYNVGLLRANFMNCGTKVYSTNPADCIIEPGYDYFTVMGDLKITAHMDAKEKDDLGWFSPSNIQYYSNQPGDYYLENTEVASNNLKVLAVPTDATFSNFIYIEFRKATGFDAYIGSLLKTNIFNGVTLHTVNASSPSGSDQISLLNGGASSGRSYTDPALQVGESFTTDNGIKIEVIGITAVNLTTSNVQIRISQQTQPTATVNPSQTPIPIPCAKNGQSCVGSDDCYNGTAGCYYYSCINDLCQYDSSITPAVTTAVTTAPSTTPAVTTAVTNAPTVIASVTAAPYVTTSVTTQVTNPVQASTTPSPNGNCTTTCSLAGQTCASALSNLIYNGGCYCLLDSYDFLGLGWGHWVDPCQPPPCNTKQWNFSYPKDQIIKEGYNVTLAVNKTTGSIRMTNLSDTWVGAKSGILGGDCQSGSASYPDPITGSKSFNCIANTAGYVTWTHYWYNCAPAGCNITSDKCSSAVNFSIWPKNAGRYTNYPCGNNLANAKCETAIGPFTIGNPQNFIKQVFQYVIGIAGSLAVLLIVYAGYLFIMSRGDKQRIQAAREVLTAAISGILFIILSVAVLQILGYQVLQIPGFGG